MKGNHKSRRNYKKGDAFAVPLENGGFAIGVAARTIPRGHTFLAYFFGPRRPSIPRLDELADLTYRDNLTAALCSDLGLINEEWTILGNISNWHDSEWPIPAFKWMNPERTQAKLVKYEISRNFNRISQTDCPLDLQGYPEEGFWGYIYAQEKLDMMLPARD